mmetsp:Transcript_18327/g.50260  ORF Transcript_18327/g.50260 Transcript_18327/m.50260 type:complete len:453 (+) Transcript_18327:176-1534(+)
MDGSKKHGNDDRGSRRPLASSSTTSAPGMKAKGSALDRNSPMTAWSSPNLQQQPGGDEEKEKADQIIAEECADHWLGSSASSAVWAPQKGKLRDFTISGKIRPGMSHPPQNPKVQEELRNYIMSCPISTRMTNHDDADVEVSDGSRASFRYAWQPPDQADEKERRSFGYQDGVAQAERQSTKQRKENSKASAAPRVSRKKSAKLAAVSPQDGRGMKSSKTDFSINSTPQGSKTLTEEDVSAHVVRFHSEARESGFAIANIPDDDLGQLAQYHSRTSRVLRPSTSAANDHTARDLKELKVLVAASQGRMGLAEPCHAAKELRELKGRMIGATGGRACISEADVQNLQSIGVHELYNRIVDRDDGDDRDSQSKGTLASKQAQAELKGEIDVQPRKQRSRPPRGFDRRHLTALRLASLANKAASASPVKLQELVDLAQVSTLTGMPRRANARGLR